MAKEVYMPALGMNQETGTLLQWFKSAGEEVRAGEPLMEIATDKTDVEIEAPASGVLRAVRAQPGDEVPVGQVIALIASPGEVVADFVPALTTRATESEAMPDQMTPKIASRESSHAVSPLAARIASEHGVNLSHVQPVGNRVQKDDVLAYLSAQVSVPTSVDSRVRASPKARRLASERFLDLATIRGSGPDGAVLAADVAAVAQSTVKTQQAVSVGLGDSEPDEIPVSRMWKVMAERLTQNWATVPHFILERDVDAGRLVAWREEMTAHTTTKVTFTDLFVKIVAVALRAHPRLNASWHMDRIVSNRDVNIGVAIAVEEGLLVPVIRAADISGLEMIAARRAELVAGAADGSLRPDDLEGGTFTISNLGMYGVDRFSAIVNPPQAAILAVGRIAERVVPVNGQAQIRPLLTLSLSCDHRVVDGARAAQFLDVVSAYAQEPLRLLS